jgi:hypothetical protein
MDTPKRTERSFWGKLGVGHPENEMMGGVCLEEGSPLRKRSSFLICSPMTLAELSPTLIKIVWKIVLSLRQKTRKILSQYTLGILI